MMRTRFGLNTTKAFIAFVIMLVILLAVASADFIPRQDMNLKNLWNLYNVKNLNVSGNASIGEELNVTGNTYLLENVYVGDVSDATIAEAESTGVDIALFEAIVNANRTLFARALKYSVAFFAQIFGNTINFTSTNLTGTFTVVGNPGLQDAILCDSIDPWVERNENMFVTIVFSVPSLSGLTGKIRNFINNTCVEISLESGGNDNVTSANFVAYRVFDPPIISILDNYFISSNVIRFDIDIPNGTRKYGFGIMDSSGIDDHKTISVETDNNDFDGISTFKGLLYSSTGVSGVNPDMFSLETDESGFNGSDLHFIHAGILGSTPEDNEIVFAHLDGDFDKLITLGSLDELAAAWYDNTTDTINVTAEFISSSLDITIFEEENSIVYIGNEGNFTTMSFSLASSSTQDLFPIFYYCNSTHEWELLTGVTDNTAGFTTSGTISFLNPDNRGNCSHELDGTPFADSTNYTYIAIERTRIFVLTPPTENLVSISGVSTSFELTPESMKVNPQLSAPQTCVAATSSLIYYNSVDNEYKYCDGSSYQSLGGGGGGVTVHNDLTGIQGGTSGEYFHWTQPAYTEATNWFTAVTASSNGNLNTPGNITANECGCSLNWTYLKKHPSPCVGSGSTQTYITALDDATTCTGISQMNGTNLNLTWFEKSNFNLSGVYFNKTGTEIDFSYYEAIKLVAYNDIIANIPTTGVKNGTWFYATDIQTLFLYQDVWKPIISFAETTIYVNSTSGSDTVGNGYLPGSGAFQTIGYAIDAIPGLVGGDVVINLSGAFEEQTAMQGKTFTGAYTITFTGEMNATLASTAITSGTQGSSNTHGTVTKAAAGWAVNAYQNKILKITYSGTDYYHLIVNNTADTITIRGGFSFAPTTENIEVLDWLTTWDYTAGGTSGANRVLDVINQKELYFRFIHFKESMAVLSYSYVDVKYSKIENNGNSDRWTNNYYSNLYLKANFFDLDTSRTGFISSGTFTNLELRECYVPNANTGDGEFVVSNTGSVVINVGSEIDGWNEGFRITENSLYRSNGNLASIINCNTGILVESDSYVNLFNTPSFSGTTTPIDYSMSIFSDYVIEDDSGNAIVTYDYTNKIMVAEPMSSATCDSTTEGGIYYDSDDNHFYGCNSTDWLQLDN